MTDEAGASEADSPHGLIRAALGLQLAFLVAVLAALGVTLASTPNDVRFLAVALVTPIVVLTSLCLWFSAHGNVWGFTGAGLLGAVGIGLRLAIDTQPSLEVGGGLPLWVTTVYVILGSLVLLTCFASVLQMKSRTREGSRSQDS